MKTVWPKCFQKSCAVIATKGVRSWERVEKWSAAKLINVQKQCASVCGKVFIPTSHRLPDIWLYFSWAGGSRSGFRSYPRLEKVRVIHVRHLIVMVSYFCHKHSNEFAMWISLILKVYVRQLSRIYIPVNFCLGKKF